MIAPKINGELLQNISTNSHTQVWQGSFNNALTITVYYTDDGSGPCAWGYVEYNNGNVSRVIFRSDDKAYFYHDPQDVVNVLIKYLHELRNIINYLH